MTMNTAKNYCYLFNKPPEIIKKEKKEFIWYWMLLIAKNVFPAHDPVL